MVWVRCPKCDDWYCTLHQQHTAECQCPPIEEWTTDPYQVDALRTLELAVDTLDQILRWRSAALRVGEELSTVGPAGYYEMTPEQWRDWALRTWQLSKEAK